MRSCWLMVTRKPPNFTDMWSSLRLTLTFCLNAFPANSSIPVTTPPIAYVTFIATIPGRSPEFKINYLIILMKRKLFNNFKQKGINLIENSRTRLIFAWRKSNRSPWSTLIVLFSLVSDHSQNSSALKHWSIDSSCPSQTTSTSKFTKILIILLDFTLIVSMNSLFYF